MCMLSRVRPCPPLVRRPWMTPRSHSRLRARARNLYSVKEKHPSPFRETQTVDLWAASRPAGGGDFGSHSLAALHGAVHEPLVLTTDRRVPPGESVALANVVAV